jgi:uncharacterized protein YqhQ
LTTRQPDDSQVEVAIVALQKVIDSEQPVMVGSDRGMTSATP